MRQARAGELDAVGELTVRVYEAEGYLDDEPTYAGRLRDAGARAAAGRVLVAEAEGTLVGAVALFLGGSGRDWAEQAEPGEAVVRMLVVDPGARGRGVGAELGRACVQLARDEGCHAVRLSSRPDMTAAHRLYGRLGFVRLPAADWEPVAGMRLLAFRLEL